MKIRTCLLIAAAALLLPALRAQAQPAATNEDPQAAYVKVTQERAAKIVATLGIADTNRADRVRDLVARQYQDLSRLHEARDAKVAEIKKQSGDDKAAAEAGIQAARTESGSKVNQLHKDYLAKLGAELTPEQVEKVKDGMTYGVAPLTYGVYLKMYPTLTDVQKRQILAWLHEARELAMDAGDSREKHAIFGKYKGRINNYLVKEGYDLKEGERNLKASNQPANNTSTK
jgi:Spy/CpxP family protein refolding chaperone